MKILILGNGGREHVFAWKISQSPLCSKLFIAPGNAGTEQCGENIELNPNNLDEVLQFCKTQSIDLVVPGNEDPLVLGITNYLEKNIPGIMVAGPSEKGARLEGSKDYAKEFMLKNNIPTARFSTFTQHTLAQGLQFLETLQRPYVLKADGLAAGKGVVICETLEDAKSQLTEMLAHSKFGKASEKVVIEEFLSGIEMSCFVLTDGKSYLMLPEAKDYKRIGEGDKGLNTGGMGAISPVPFASETFLNKVKSRIIEPTIKGLRENRSAYKGFIFIGLMNCNGEPLVIEYNVRMGDPETEVVIPRIENDLVELLEAVCKKQLHKHSIQIKPVHAATVFTVSGGYPQDYEKGKCITGIDKIPAESIAFHAGTKKEKDGGIFTNGGRVIAITGIGESMSIALEKAFIGAESITFENKYYRKDIGRDLMSLEQ